MGVWGEGTKITKREYLDSWLRGRAWLKRSQYGTSGWVSMFIIPNANNEPLFNCIQIVTTVRHLLIIVSLVFCYQTMDNHFQQRVRLIHSCLSSETQNSQDSHESWSMLGLLLPHSWQHSYPGTLSPGCWFHGLISFFFSFFGITKSYRLKIKLY